ALWREIMNTGDGTFHGELQRALTNLSLRLAESGTESATTRSWFFDERRLGERLAQWPGYPSRCSFTMRHFENGNWRIDRADWKDVPDLDGIADAHLLRPG